MYGSSFGVHRCEHDREQLVVGSLSDHIDALRPLGPSIVLDLVLALREHFKLGDVIRICPSCFCVTALDGVHASRASNR
jgi:hypothetical protein